MQRGYAYIGISVILVILSVNDNKVQAQCPVLVPPGNGALSTTDIADSTIVTVTCDSGYTLNGEATLGCNSNTWSDDVGTCEADDCEALAGLNNGALSSTDVTSGTIVTVSCDTGYKRTGDATLTCTAGSWSSTAVTCDAAVDCPALTAPANGALSSTDMTHDTVVKVTCDTDYTLTGDNELICDDGTWSSTVGTCAKGSGSFNSAAFSIATLIGALLFTLFLI
ncbi:P-selectin-like [Glandiceps talaboti]